jgi:hypothetical protein
MLPVTLYSIFDRENAEPEAPAAVPEKFSWFAALLPPVFGLAHGLWLELLGFVVTVALIAGASLWLGAAAGFWLYVLFAVLIGLEAPSLRRAGLKRKGWTYRTELVAEAGDLAQVEWLRRRGAAL